MDFVGIVRYTLRAAVFAAAIGGVYALYCLLLSQKLRWLRLIGIMYIAALVQITVLRGGINWQAVFHESRDLPQLIPLKTTIGEAKLGLWKLVYHTVGNMGWFVPLGMLLRRGKAAQAVLIGAALSLGIEASQYLLMTGMADIDDIILNALGALAGWMICNIKWRRLT